MNCEEFVNPGAGFPSYDDFTAHHKLYRAASPLLVGYRVEYAKYSCFWDGPCATGAGVVVEIDSLYGRWAEVRDDRGYRVRIEGCYAYRIVDIPTLSVGQRIAYGTEGSYRIVEIKKVSGSVYWHGDAAATPEGHVNLVRSMNGYPTCVLLDASAARLLKAGLPLSSVAHYPAEVSA